MASITTMQKEYLQSTYQDRVTFHPTERKLYGHDVGDLPKLIKPLVGNTTPDGVIQPSSEEELQALARWASENGIALTPRGKATSGYGGVLPVKKGLVVDFYRMSRIIKMIFPMSKAHPEKRFLVAIFYPGYQRLLPETLRLR